MTVKERPRYRSNEAGQRSQDGSIHQEYIQWMIPQKIPYKGKCKGKHHTPVYEKTL